MPINVGVALSTLSVVSVETTFANLGRLLILYHVLELGLLEWFVAINTVVVVLLVTRFTYQRAITHHLEGDFSVDFFLAATTLLDQRSIQDVVSATGWAITGHIVSVFRLRSMVKYYSHSYICQASYRKRSGEQFASTTRQIEKPFNSLNVGCDKVKFLCVMSVSKRPNFNAGVRMVVSKI